MTESENTRGPELILYGGAFDPPHRGHVDCVAEALVVFPGAQIFVSPGFVPAGIKGSHKEPVASFEDRIALAQAAFVSPRTGSRVQISEIEKHLERPNYTYRTILELAARYPGRRLGMMIGLDQFKIFQRWKEPLQILAQSDIVVVRRDTNESIVKVAQGLADQLGLVIEWKNDHKLGLLRSEGFVSHIYIIDTDTAKASSSEIKFRLSVGKDVPEGWLTEEIKTLIEAKGFYKGDVVE